MQKLGWEKIFKKIWKVAAAWRSIALAVDLKEVVPTLEVNKINNHNPDLFIINHLDQPLEAKISYQWPATFLPEEELT